MSPLIYSRILIAGRVLVYSRALITMGFVLILSPSQSWGFHDCRFTYLGRIDYKVQVKDTNLNILDSLGKPICHFLGGATTQWLSREQTNIDQLFTSLGACLMGKDRVDRMTLTRVITKDLLSSKQFVTYPGSSLQLCRDLKPVQSRRRVSL